MQKSKGRGEGGAGERGAGGRGLFEGCLNREDEDEYEENDGEGMAERADNEDGNKEEDHIRSDHPVASH